MNQNIVETIAGIIVIIAAGFFLNFAYNKSNRSAVADSYVLSANFEDCTGINEGSEIMIAGVKVGYVDKILLNKDSFLSQIFMRIDKSIKLGLDSKASVSSSGFLGGKFIAISPGQSEEVLKPDGTIKYTQSAISIENLIGKFMYSVGSKE